MPDMPSATRSPLCYAGLLATEWRVTLQMLLSLFAIAAAIFFRLRLPLLYADVIDDTPFFRHDTRRAACFARQPA